MTLYVSGAVYNRKRRCTNSKNDKRRITMVAVVDKETCTGCENCVDVCPVDAIEMVDGKAVVSDACIDCGQCVDECPVEAISMD